jgi:hypothetical protein
MRYESMPHSKSAESYLRNLDDDQVKMRSKISYNLPPSCQDLGRWRSKGMIGSGRASVAAAADLSRAFVEDMGDSAPSSVYALASLGSFGAHTQNQERDLHKWVRHLYNINLSTFDVQCDMQA